MSYGPTNPWDFAPTEFFRHLHCPRDESFEDCNLIHVDLSALKSAKIRVPLDQKDQDAYMVLKKVSQQGIEVLDQEKSRASATITFKVHFPFDDLYLQYEYVMDYSFIGRKGFRYFCRQTETSLRKFFQRRRKNSISHHGLRIPSRRKIARRSIVPTFNRQERESGGKIVKRLREVRS